MEIPAADWARTNYFNFYFSYADSLEGTEFNLELTGEEWVFGLSPVTPPRPADVKMETDLSSDDLTLELVSHKKVRNEFLKIPKAVLEYFDPEERKNLDIKIDSGLKIAPLKELFLVLIPWQNSLKSL